MVVARSLARIQPRWIAPPPTSAADGEVCGEERPLQARSCAAFLRDRSCQASVTLCRDLWHRARCTHSRGHH